MKKRIISVGMCAVIIAVTVFSNTLYAATKGIVPKEKKDEILVTTDANGKVIDEKSYVTLVGSNAQKSIKDKTKLTNIKNVSGAEEFKANYDGTITWENNGNDIKYIGDLDADLPLSMNVSYYLNDEEIQPEDLAGKSGRIKVVYDFTNNQQVQVDIDGEKYTTYVPLMTLTSITLPMDGFSNVESLDGALTVNELGEKYFLLGVTAPGSEEALNLKILGLGDYIRIPSSFGFTADVKNCQMPSTTTCVIPHILDNLDLSDIKTTSDIDEKVNELVEATEKLVAGSTELSDGTSLATAGVLQFVNGIKEGMNQLTDGSAQMNGDLSDLEKKKDDIQNKATLLAGDLNQVLTEAKAFKIPDADSFHLSEYQQAGEKLQADTDDLIEALENMQKQLEELQVFATETEQKIQDIQSEINAEIDAVDIDKMVEDAKVSAGEQVGPLARQVIAEEYPKLDKILSFGYKAGIISEDKVDEIAKKIVSRIDLSSVGDGAKAQINEIKEKINTEINDIQIPEIDVDVDSVIAILEDMQTQYEVLTKVTDTQDEINSLLDSANELMDSIDKNSTVINNKSNELISGLGFADETIKNARSYLKTLNAAAVTAKDGSNQLVDGMNALDDGAKTLAAGTEQFYKEGVLTAADYAKQATLQALIKRGQAHIKAAETYTNLTGIDDSTKGSIRFTIKTAAIKSTK